MALGDRTEEHTIPRVKWISTKVDMRHATVKGGAQDGLSVAFLFDESGQTMLAAFTEVALLGTLHAGAAMLVTNNQEKKLLDNDIGRKLVKVRNLLQEICEATGGSHDHRRPVACSHCRKDLSESEAVGGMVFCGQAICPDCSPGVMVAATAQGAEDKIQAKAEPGEKFADFIRRVRGD